MEEFLIPLQITQRSLAKAIHAPYRRINDSARAFALILSPLDIKRIPGLSGDPLYKKWEYSSALEHILSILTE